MTRNVAVTGILATLLAISLAVVAPPGAGEASRGLISSVNQFIVSSPYVTTFQIQQNRTDFTPWVLYPVNNTVWVVTVRQGDPTAKRPLYSQIVNFTVVKAGQYITTPIITLRNAIPPSIVFDKYSDSGRVWFLENDSLAYYDPANLSRNYRIAATFSGGYPEYMTIDQQDRIWITLLGTNQIVEYKYGVQPLRYNLTTGCALTSFGCGLQGITVDPRDGSIWFAEAYAGEIGHLIPCNPQPCARMNHTGPPSLMNIAGVSQVTVDSNGVVWFTVHEGNEFGSYNPHTQEWKLFPIGYCSASFPDCFIGLPNAISAVGDQVWFSEHIAGRIARYNESNGILTEYNLPSSSPFCRSGCPPYAWWMWPGSEDRIWFTSIGLGEIGYVNATLPVPFSVNSVSATVVAQGGSVNIPVSVTFIRGSPPSINASATNDDTSSNPPILSWSLDPEQVHVSDGNVFSTLSITAAFNSTIGPRYMAVSAYNENATVNVFIKVDIIACTPHLWTCTPALGMFTTVGFAWGISAFSLATFGVNWYSKKKRNNVTLRTVRPSQ